MTPINGPTPEKRRILCVDDHAETRALLEELLGHSGLEAVCVRDAAAARLLLDGGELFRLYILDDQSPGGSGLTMCEEIRRRDKETPIIIFSGHAHVCDRDAGLRAGADVYIVKPAANQIVPTVRQLLGVSPATPGSNGKNGNNP